MTINKSCKYVGRQHRSGNIENPGATQRWVRIHHHIFALREHQNKKIKKKTMQKYVKLDPGRMERDKADVRNIRTCIDTWVPDLWKHGHPMTNFASGEIATDEMVNDIIDLKNRGEVARDEFIQRFTKNDSKLKYYDPIKRNQLGLSEKETKKKKHSIPENEG